MGVFADTVRALAKAASTPRFPGGWSSIAWRGSSSAEGDWRKIIGDGSSSSIVEACVLWICRNFPEAPAVVVQTGDDAIPQTIRHPFARKIRWPNPYYSGVLLWYGTLTSWVIDGNAYWLKVRDQLGRVVELWYIPHWMIQPRWPLDGSEYISHYEYRPAGELLRLDPADVFHLRYGIDPDNTRKGRSPLRTLFLELGVDHEASHFSAAILKNLGVPGVVISPDKESKGAMDEQAREAIKAKFKQSFGGDNRGDPIVLSKPTNIMQFGFSPAELDLGAIRDIPEERVTAVLAWAVAGCVLWQRDGLGTPPVIESATQSYREAQDPVADFVAESCVVEDGAWATVEELYAAYSAWAKAAGERQPLAKRGFAHRLERHGFAAAKGAKGVRIRRGIGLREQQRLGMAAAGNADGDPSEDGIELPT